MNAHFLIAQCMKHDDQDLLDLILNLDFMMPEVLSMMHDIFVYIKHHKLSPTHPIHQQFSRINEVYNIVSDTILQTNQILAIRTAINQLSLQMRHIQSATFTEGIIQKQADIRQWTPEFICIMCIYYHIPSPVWYSILEQTRAPFKSSCRAIALYFHNKEVAVMYHQNDITPREIFALCQSNPSRAPINYLKQITADDELDDAVIDPTNKYAKEFDAILQFSEDEEDEDEDDELGEEFKEY